MDIREDSRSPIGPTPTTPSINVDSQLIQRPVDNPLHSYASYTYNLSLHMLTINDYNQIVNNNFLNNQPSPYVPKNVIISSAGRYNDTDFKRNSNFREDFYFEDFKMQTVITPNMRNRNSNMIECSFTIIEPNGFTLINRMIAAANQINVNSVRAPGSYIQLPYVLQIDFFGYSDITESKPEKISSLTKIIPIRIITVETQVRQSGAEYRVEAVAFNHQAYSQINSAIPFNTTIQATSVSQAFNGAQVTDENINQYVTRLQTETDLQREISQLQQIRNNLIRDADIAVNTTFQTDLTDTDKTLSSVSSRLSELKNTALNQQSVCSALTSYYEALKKRGEIEQSTQFRVEFDKEIGDAKITDFNAAPSSAPAAGTSNASQINYSGGTINIPAGSTIDKLIEFIVRNSSYVLDQISNLVGGGVIASNADVANGKISVEQLVQLQSSQPLKWFKIVPTVKLGEWDNKQGRYVPEIIIFYVRTFTISSKYPYGPRGRVPGYVKKYDYLFTGRNRDIIDWNINFNTLYLLALTGALNKNLQGVTAPGLNPNGTAPASGSETKNPLPIDLSTDQVATPGVTHIATDSRINTLNHGSSVKSQASGDLANSLLLDARGDMIELELKILGDPQFIKQDDIFYGRSDRNSNQALTPNGSLYMDTGELYVFVNFLSPVDYSEEKGIAEIRANDILGPEQSYVDAKNSVLGYSNFSGVYKLITVDSVFSRGKFEQTLRMAKVLYDQRGRQISANSVQTGRELSVSNNSSIPTEARATNTSQNAQTVQTNQPMLTMATMNLTPIAGKVKNQVTEDDILQARLTDISTTQPNFVSSDFLDLGWRGDLVSLG